MKKNNFAYMSKGEGDNVNFSFIEDIPAGKDSNLSEKFFTDSIRDSVGSRGETIKVSIENKMSLETKNLNRLVSHKSMPIELSESPERAKKYIN